MGEGVRPSPPGSCDNTASSHAGHPDSRSGTIGGRSRPENVERFTNTSGLLRLTTEPCGDVSEPYREQIRR